jgi:hypothetical protein
MKHWRLRAQEEQRLLNPSFCSILLWNAASAYRSQADGDLAMPFVLLFLLLLTVLHAETRNSLPHTTATSFAAWLSEHSVGRATIADRARTLVPFTKEAILFGSVHGLFSVNRNGLIANSEWKRHVKTVERASKEVRSCIKRAAFVGKWFAKAGDAETVMALVGVRP